MPLSFACLPRISAALSYLLALSMYEYCMTVVKLDITADMGIKCLECVAVAAPVWEQLMYEHTCLVCMLLMC